MLRSISTLERNLAHMDENNKPSANDGITTVCINGDLQVGDLVLSTPADDYACMVGTVLEINKLGSRSHDEETYNPTDDVHVNFMALKYSEQRFSEISQMLGELYGRPTTPGILPPIDVDDVIMSPDVLIRITGIPEHELRRVLDNYKNAADYCAGVEARISGNKESVTEILYSPLAFYLHNPREEERNGEYGTYDLYDERYSISPSDATEYMDAIELAVRRDRDRMDGVRGLAEYVPESLDDLIVSIFPRIETHDGKLWCAAHIVSNRAISPGEMGELAQWWEGQLSDGWGEGFEQREVKIGGGEELYVVPRSSDSFFIDTEREFYARLGIEPPGRNRDTRSETPAEAALHEPEYYEDADTGVYRDMLIDRVNSNYIEYINGFRDKDELVDYSSDIATISEAHYYISEIHNFHFSELDYLLKFQNPLLVVAEAFEGNRDEEHSNIMWKVFHEMDALNNSRHLLVSYDSAAPDETTLNKQTLFDRLDKNIEDYRECVMCMDKQEIFEASDDITARYAVREFMKTAYDYKTGEVEYLLQFQSPLELIASDWPATLDGLVDMSEVVADILEHKDSHGHYAKVIDATNPASKESARMLSDIEKPSVLARIRDAARIPQEPRKDKPARNNSELEL